MGKISRTSHHGKAHEVQSTAKTKKKEPASLIKTKEAIKKVAHVPVIIHTLQKYPPKSQKRTIDQTQKLFNRVKGFIVDTAKRKAFN